MASLSERTALLIIANGIKYAVAFLLPMIFVRFMSQGEYGTYQQMTLLVNVCSGVMVLGLPTSIYYFYAHTDRPTLVAQTQIMLLVAGGVAALAVAYFAPELAARMHNPRLGSLIPSLTLYIGLFIAAEHFIPVMISQNRYVTAVGIEFLETVFRVVALSAILALGYHLHAIVVALIVYAGGRLIIRSTLLLIGRDSVRKASWSKRFTGEQLRYSMPLAASTCVGLVGGLLDKAIVAFSFSPVAYAIYSVGALEIPLDSIFQGSVANVLRASLPALIQDGRLDEVVRIWRESVRKLALIMIPSFVFLSFFADRLITTLFTKRYAASTEVFHIYLLVLPLYMFILTAIPQVFGKTRINLYVVGIMVSSNALLSFVFLRIIGILGPAMAFACSNYMGSALYFAVTVKLLRTSPLKLLPTSALVRTAAVACLAIAPAFVAGSITRGMVSILGGAAVFAACYLLLGYFIGIFRTSDIAIARAWIRRLVPTTP